MKSYKPSLLELNGDGKPELAIMVNCAKSKSCELWIFREVKNDFTVVLRTSWELEMFEIKRTKTKGFFDIQTSYDSHYPESEELKSMDDYKFDGKEYKFSGCSALVNVYYDKNGQLHHLKKPRLEHYDDCC